MIKTAPTSLKIRQLITDIQNGALVPRPEFQRRLVWSMTDKNNFIETILSGYPFPEIYIADGDVNLETGKGTQLLVDGQQRITTISEYFSGAPSLKLQKGITGYHYLSDQQKKDFLNYDVAVRNLGIVSKDQIIEVFRRINSTNYSLNDMEINNAMYAGRFKNFCQELAELEFFESHSFFRPMQLRRMGDVKFTSTIIITMIGGYFNRDDLHEEYLRRYNDEFPEERSLRERFTKTLALIDEMEFSNDARVWKQTDFFTLVCELDDFISVKNNRVNLKSTKANLEKFYLAVDADSTSLEDAGEYLKATIQAANDRGNRVLRGRAIKKRFVAVSFGRSRS